LPKFWKEVDRILKPGGVFAAIVYDLNRFGGNPVMAQQAQQVLGKVRVMCATNYSSN